jgi:hypothetical protein
LVSRGATERLEFAAMIQERGIDPQTTPPTLMRRALIVALLAGVTISCASTRQSRYAVTIRNSSSSELRRVVVAFGEYLSNEWHVRPGQSITELSLTCPITESVFVVCETMDGTVTRRNVPLKSVIGEVGLRDEIVFYIRDNDVTVWRKPKAQ